MLEMNEGLTMVVACNGAETGKDEKRAESEQQKQIRSDKKSKG